MRKTEQETPSGELLGVVFWILSENTTSHKSEINSSLGFGKQNLIYSKSACRYEVFCKRRVQSHLSAAGCLWTERRTWSGLPSTLSGSHPQTAPSAGKCEHKLRWRITIFHLSDPSNLHLWAHICSWETERCWRTHETTAVEGTTLLEK